MLIYNNAKIWSWNTTRYLWNSSLPFHYYLSSQLSSLSFLKKWTTKSKLLPGLKPWPIIRNIHQLGNKPHRSVTELSKIYRPIMTLKLGSVTTIVISSSKVAQDLYLTHDLAISSRVVPQAGKAGNHHKFSIIWLPVCPKWCVPRKIATIQLFTAQRLKTSQILRENKVKELVEYVHECCKTCTCWY